MALRHGRLGILVTPRFDRPNMPSAAISQGKETCAEEQDQEDEHADTCGKKEVTSAWAMISASNRAKGRSLYPLIARRSILDLKLSFRLGFDL